MKLLRGILIVVAIAVVITATYNATRAVVDNYTSYVAASDRWEWEWPKTDFSKMTIKSSEIKSGGPPRDGIPSIDDPEFIDVAESDLDDREPVISINIKGEAKAYPIQILIYHEIVNDVVGGLPVAVTYCPLCNSSVVFDRRIEGKATTFGTTGKLRHYDMVMYDRATESWWQQFTGEAIVGEHAGKKLKQIPAKMESVRSFKKSWPKGKMLVPNFSLFRSYGDTPYAEYDKNPYPPFFDGNYNEKIPALARVVSIRKDAWPLKLIREKGRIEYKDLVIIWQEGRASALDTKKIAKGKEVGNVVVKRRDKENVVYNTAFAFAFKAFHPDGVIHYE